MTIDEQIISLRKHDLLCHDSDLQIAEWLEELKVLREKAKGDKWYQQGRADKEAEVKPLFEAIRFVLEDYATRLGDYSKVIDAKLKEQTNFGNYEESEDKT